jgi:hypothetical protein
MKDAYERRALLMQLGNVLEMLAYVEEHVYDAQTVGDLIRKYDALADVALLGHVAQTMSVRELRYRTLRAFAGWPQLLLDTPLDRSALATPVRELLFDDNPFGWESWAASLVPEVPWIATAAPDPALT